MSERRGIRKSARRRVRTGAALFLCLYAFAGVRLFALLSSVTGLGGAGVSASASLLFFGLPACLGLFVVDGDHRELLAARRLSGAQAMWLAAAGALLVFPMALLAGLLSALPARFGFEAARQTAEAPAFLPMLLCSGLIAPVCEELFFRGYLLGVFERGGRRGAAVVTALLFACCHGIGLNTPVYIVIGLLLSAVTLRMGSVTGALIAHAAYNISLLLLSVSGAGTLVEGLTPHGVLLCALGGAAAYYALLRAWRARGVRSEETLSLSRRDGLRMVISLLLVALLQLLSEVLFP